MGGVRLGVRCCAICVALALLPLCIQGHTGGSSSSWNDSAEEMAEKVAEMFYHSYRGYMTHAFPHDELKPLSKSYSDSLGELGNLDLEHLTEGYQGVALTLIDSLSTLAILGNASEFERQVWWVCDSISFDLDVRVNVFEANIRLLGGLLSAHSLAADPELQLIQHRRYNDELLHLALDLGERLLPAFSESPTGIPFGWVNLRHGVRRGETTETNTAAVGSLILEHGMLSRLTGDPRFEEAALRGLLVLWAMRSGTTGLWGTALCMSTLRWLSPVAGTGPSADSFYEYLLKAYLLFGDERYWELFQDAYRVSLQHLRDEGGWYQDVEIVSGEVTYRQMVSLQAFWPGMQVLAGDLELAQETFLQFFSVWRQYHLLPERFLYRKEVLHPSERSYQLRPELIESLYYLYRATRRKEYRMAGTMIYDSLQDYTKVEGGHAVIRDVVTMLKEDHMPSFFLAETCMYLYLLFDDSSFAHDERWLFTTEGHPLPIDARIHDQTRTRLGSDRDVFRAAKAFAVKQRQRILEPRRRSGWSSATQRPQQSDATFWPLAPGTVIHDVARATAQSLMYSTANSGGESAQSAQGSIAALVSAVMASLQRAQGGASDSGMVDLEGTSGFQRIVFHAPGGVELVLEPGGGVRSSQADPDEDGIDAQPKAWTENQLVVPKSGRLTRVELSRTSWGSEDEAFVEGYDEQGARQPADDEAALQEGEESDVEWATAHRTPDLRHRRTMGDQPSTRREGDPPKQGSIGAMDAEQSIDAGWGRMGSKLAALDVRMCINFDYGSTHGSQPTVRSLCHVQDHAEDHRCTSHGHCGVDRWVCRNRVCSNAGYCTTVR